MTASPGATARSRHAALGAGLSLALVFGCIGFDTGVAAAVESAGGAAQSAAALATFPSAATALPAGPVAVVLDADTATVSWPTALDPSASAGTDGSDPADSTLVLLVLPGEDVGGGVAPITALQPSATADAEADAASIAAGLPLLERTDEAAADPGSTLSRITGLTPGTDYRFALRTVPTDAATLAAAVSPIAESPASEPVTTPPLTGAPDDSAPTPGEDPTTDLADPAQTPPEDTGTSPDPAPSAPSTPAAPSAAARDATPSAAAVPGTPEAPRGTPAGPGAIEVTWPAVGSGAPVVTYSVTAFRDGTPVRTVAGIDPLLAGTSALVGGLLANTAYTFTVTAVGAGGSSQPSPPSTAVTTAKGATTPPMQPMLAGLRDDPLGLLATWTAPVSDGGYPVTGYTVELFSGSTVNLANLVRRTDVPASSTSLALPRIGIVGSSLAVRVIASNGAGETASSLSTAYRIAATAPVTTRVATPTVADGPTPGTLRVVWTAPTGATDATRYLLRIATTDGVSAAITAAVADLTGDFARSGPLEATIENPSPGRGVSVQITAYEPESLAGLVPVAYRTSSLRSATVTTVGASVPQRPDRPGSVTSESVDRITVAGTTIAATAGNGADITAFDLLVFRAGSVDPVATTRVPAVVSADDPSRLTHAPVVITGLLTNTGYTVRAAAVNTVGTGPSSAASAIVTTLAVAPPGSIPPSWTSLAALREAVKTGSVSGVAAEDAGLPASVEPTTTLEPSFPWPGSGGATGGEVWLFGSAADDRAPVYLGAFSIVDGTATGSLPIGELADGDYALGFVPTTGPTAAVEITVEASTGGPTTIDDAVLRWGFSNEANNGAFFGGCNFLTAGRIPDVGAGTILDESRYSATSGAVSIEKPNASGAYELASFATRCLDRSGRTVDSNTTSSFTDSQLVIVGGTGTVDPSTNSGTISWTGDFSVAFYGGLTYWYGSNPVLTVVDGVGTLTATASGFGTDMADQTKWTAIPPRDVVLATLVGVTMRSDGFTVSPQYVGVKIEQGDQVAQTAANASYWGSFPQSFVDFQALTGQFSYWFSSGGRQDPGKIALPLTVGFDASTFVAVAPPGGSADAAVDLVPSAKRSPFALKAPGAPAAAPAAAAGQQVTEIVTLMQAGPAPIPASQVVPLFIALLALLGGLTVVAAAGGGLIASGVLKP